MPKAAVCCCNLTVHTPEVQDNRTLWWDKKQKQKKSHQMFFANSPQHKILIQFFFLNDTNIKQYRTCDSNPKHVVISAKDHIFEDTRGKTPQE